MPTDQIQSAQIYLLSLVDKNPDLKSQDLLDLAMECLYFDYLSLAQALSMLKEKKLLLPSERKYEAESDLHGAKVKRMSMTPQGKAVLETLYDRLPVALQQQNKEAPRPLERRAYFLPNPNRGFDLHLIEEKQGSELFSISLLLPTEAMARKACERFESRGDLFYQDLLSLLFNPSEKKEASEEA